MDGLRQVTVRIEHDCPLARLSRAVPEAELQSWTGHRLEVVQVRCPPAAWPRVEAAARQLLSPLRLLCLPGGGVIVWEPRIEEERSLSRTLEAHRLLWLQPVRLRRGWEHYDAIAFGDGEQGALDDLARRWPTQVARRRSVGPEAVLESLFHSLAPVLEGPTPKQAEALVAAARAGYYRSPRGATTAEVAAVLGLSRSAFEERLRGGENRLMEGIVPALAAHEGRLPRPRQMPKRRGGVGTAWTSGPAATRS